MANKTRLQPKPKQTKPSWLKRQAARKALQPVKAEPTSQEGTDGPRVEE